MLRGTRRHPRQRLVTGNLEKDEAQAGGSCAQARITSRRITAVMKASAFGRDCSMPTREVKAMCSPAG